jgi:hypothetical protein
LTSFPKFLIVFGNQLKGVLKLDNEKKVVAVFKKEAKPLSSKEVADLTGIDKKEVDKIIKKLKDSDQLDSPKRCYYQIR